MFSGTSTDLPGDEEPFDGEVLVVFSDKPRPGVPLPLCVEVVAGNRLLVADYGGEVPQSLDELVKLRGVGRKTASVVLAEVWDVPAIAVDTHVKRVSNRLGLASASDPVKIEFALMDLAPERSWTFLSHALIWHGRRVCGARKPACDRCPLVPECPFPGRPSA